MKRMSPAQSIRSMGNTRTGNMNRPKRKRLMFEPENRNPATIPKNIKVRPDDWVVIERLAKKVGESPAEIARQAISYALETMGD